ncbi:MAG: NAD(P)/FAD-dependent oxidoreductase [Candidatus Magnetobacterium sp. LHC-1]|uniref:Geranylgeranyl reductase family protein n=1 Tax=Candidatus Magnetobacterium casense TaxID=1455061 RepID=A0ABS6RX60_9BACT|nr:NAD(P)/FAD-dependent oxidoreductase [Candidatus Magnetobacterium casensis]MBF0606903.1 geranylgeranyl reductase family protein [Nitrospirota bacterium]MBV6341224.1 geranylgeranyl reductase family protein [Candidatus Magnetobacterium casensis]
MNIRNGHYGVSNIPETQVAVVGGGPAGATCAMLLADAGIETVLIERDLSNNKPCGGGLIATAFKEFDLPVHTIRKMVTTLRLIAPSGKTREIPLPQTQLAIIDRPGFDAALRTRAQERGAHLMTGQCRGITVKDGRVILTVGTNDWDSTQIRARYVVAADGVNSRLRRLLTGSLPNRLYTLHEIIKGHERQTCDFMFGSAFAPNFYSWVFPHAEGISLGTGCVDVPRAGGYLKNCLAAYGINSGGQQRGYYIPFWDNRLYFKAGVFFVGDAAAQVMPFTFEGIYYAMKSAEFVVAAITEGKPSLYKSLWVQRFKKRFVLMKILQGIFLRNDKMAESLVSLHEQPDIQQAAMRFWMHKEGVLKSPRMYINYLTRHV